MEAAVGDVGMAPRRTARLGKVEWKVFLALVAAAAATAAIVTAVVVTRDDSRAGIVLPLSLKRDAGCADWACARKLMLDVIDEEFAGIDQPGTSIRVFTAANGTQSYVDDPGWFRCSKIDFGSPALLDDASLRSEIAALSLGELCDPRNGTMRGDATCLAFWASIRSVIRLRDEFEAGPLFWRYAAVNWFEDGVGWSNERFPIESLSMPSSVWIRDPDYRTYASWSGGGADVDANVTYGGGGPPTVALGDPGDVAAWMLCEMLTTTLTVSSNQVEAGTCGPTAVLVSMMDNMPAQAIKTAVQIGARSGP